MVRPREFNREAALAAAIETFAEHGFEGSSTEDLLRAMGISRQSLYDTFGDKRRLYLAALHHYNSSTVTDMIRTLDGAASPLQGIEATLQKFAAAQDAVCMGIQAITEFGRSDLEITAIIDGMARTWHTALERRLIEAKALNEIADTIDIGDAAQFISATMSGVKIGARSGLDSRQLQAIVQMAMRSLK